MSAVYPSLTMAVFPFRSVTFLIGGFFERESFNVAAITMSWAALEGKINSISSIGKYAKKLQEHEVAFLEEKDLRMGDQGKFEEYTLYKSTSKKILFILTKFSTVKIPVFKSGVLWRDLKDSENYRNILIHPRNGITHNDMSFKKTELVYETVKSMIKLLDSKILDKK